MHKLIILIESPDDSLIFDESWPSFLHQAEKMPGLIQETNARIEHTFFGSQQIYMVHELFFENQAALQAAMASPQGQVSGHILQRITDGKMTLLAAEHKEDDIENLRKYQAVDPNADSNTDSG